MRDAIGVLDAFPEAVSAAWDEEIAHRVVDFEAGGTPGLPYEQVRAKLLAMIDSHARCRPSVMTGVD